MGLERKLIVAEDFIAETSLNSTTPETWPVFSAETVLEKLKEIDGWKTRPVNLEVTKYGTQQPLERKCVELIKDNRGVRVFFSPLNGSVIKVAGVKQREVLIRKEIYAWSLVQEVFEQERKSNPCIVTLPDLPLPMLGLEMPYYGVPLKYWGFLTGIPIPRAQLDEFKSKMVRLVYEQGLVQRDMNLGNILVRLNNSRVELMPIDWELSHTVLTTPRNQRGKEAEFVEDLARRTLQPFY